MTEKVPNTNMNKNKVLREANESLVLAAHDAWTKMKAAADAIAPLPRPAGHDSLTGMPNRALLTDRLTQAIALAERHGKTVALRYLDFDFFRSARESHRHPAGDQVVQSVAERLQACVRHSDTVTVSRQEGDEFAVLLPEVEGINDAC